MPNPGHHTPPTPEAGSHRHFLRMILADVIPTEQLKKKSMDWEERKEEKLWMGC